MHAGRFMKSSTSSGPSLFTVFMIGLLAITCCIAPLIIVAMAAGALPLIIGTHQTLVAVLASVVFVSLSLALWSGSRRQSSFAIVRDALRMAFTAPALFRTLLLLAFIGAPLTVFYLVALPAERFGALAWGALQFLTPGDAIAAVLLGIGVPLSIALNVAAQKTRVAQTSLTFGGVIAALLPSSLCCTTLIPSALAALGASVPAVMHLSGRFQGFFAQYAPAFIGFAVAAVLFSLWMAASNLASNCTTCSFSAKES